MGDIYNAGNNAFSASWLGTDPQPLSLASLELAMQHFANEPPQPHYYEWACSQCTRAGKATDAFAKCPFCGGASVLATRLECPHGVGLDHDCAECEAPRG